MKSIDLYQEVLALFLTKSPSDELLENSINNANDYLKLQDHCSSYTRIPWVTGTSIIEAVTLIVRSAFENGNIITKT